MPHKMLIVDDEAANLRLLERLFRRAFHVLTAESGLEAMRALEQPDVALIITDQRMPGKHLVKFWLDFLLNSNASSLERMSYNSSM